VNVVFAPEALEDLTATTEYISRDDPVAAARLADRVFEMVEHLAAGGLDGPEQTLASGERVRSWPVPPLRIYYERAADHFVVLRIYHQARESIAR
jgi:plasmid stabilization system protein ParE